MKKLISMICALAMLAQGISAAAAEAPAASVPNLEPAVKEQLLAYDCDKDGDGEISAGELSALRSVWLDLTDVSDLSFLKEIPHLQVLCLENGSFSDLAMLTSLPTVMSLTLRNMTLDDLSFLHNMCLDCCMLENVQCNTEFDKTELLRLHDYTFEQGYAESIEILPYELFEDSEFEITIDDHSMIYEDDEYGSNRGVQDLYTLNTGETPFHVFLSGKEIYQGTITVTPQNITHEPITGNVIKWADYTFPNNTGSIVDTRIGSRMFRISGGTVTPLREGVSALQSVYLDSTSGNSSYYRCTMELHTDGTLLVDGEQVLPDEHFIAIRENCALTADHTLYAIYHDKNSNVYVKITDQCAEILTSEDFPLFLMNNGSVYLYSVYDSFQPAHLSKTDIAEPKQYFYGYLVDENNVLWNYEKRKLTKVAEDVSEVGIYMTSTGEKRSCYLRTDGTACLLDGSGTVTIAEEPACELKNAVNGSFFFNDWYVSGEKSEGDCGGRWRLSNDGILTISYQDQRFAIDNAVNVITEDYDEAAGRHYVYFARRDASLWRYCIESASAELYIEGEEPSAESAAGDLNHDSKVSAADAVMLTKWLTGQETAAFSLQDADMNRNGIVNAADLSLLKQTLLKQSK